MASQNSMAQPNPVAPTTRRFSTAKLASPLHNTPASISQLSAIYNRDRHSSSSTTNTATDVVSSSATDIGTASNGNGNANGATIPFAFNNTPSSRKFHRDASSIALHPPPYRSSSPAIESDDESSSNNGIITSPIGSYGSFVDDPTIMKSVSKHLPTNPDNALKLPSGDITRDLYNQTILQQQPSIRRSKSFSGGDDPHRRGSMASQMRLPGGFRRDFIQTKKQKFGYTLSTPTNFTKNFLEFLTIYGHFAGEDLEDEDYMVCDYDTSDTNVTDEESPLLRESSTSTADDTSHKTSSLKAFFLLIKAFIGTGVLFLPKAFSNGGLAFCIGLLLIFSVLSYYCYLILAETTILTKISSFPGMGHHLMGKHMRTLILVSIIVTQIGFVAAYTVFTAENLRAFVRNTTSWDFPLSHFVIFETLCFVPMSLIRNITKLSVAALLANVFILSGICTIVIYTALDLIENGPAQDIVMFNSDSWSLFIGVAIFAFEGIGLIIPVQQSMRNPKDFPKVLLAVMVVCSILFISVGTLCYVTYGSQVQTVIILNLPQESPFVRSIQLTYSLAIMLSVPLQLLPAIRLMEQRLFARKVSGKTSNATKWTKNTFRTFVTMATSAVAYCGSGDLDAFVSWVGVAACIPLVYMYPPLLHMRATAPTEVLSWWVDAAMTVLGGIAMLYTGYSLLQ